METRIEAVNSVAKKLLIELSPEDVKTPFEEAVRKIKRTANVPGFRRGKAPEALIRARYKKELEGEIIRSMSEKYYPEAVRKHSEEIGPVIYERMVDGRLQPDLTMKMEFYLENLPVFELKPVNDVTLTVPPQTGDLEQQLQSVLQQIREQRARLKPLEKESAESDDYVEVSLTGTDADGHTVLSHENLDLQLKAEGSFAPIVPHLIGMKPGEEKTVTVTYPEDDAFGNLKGRDVAVTATLIQIKEREVPEANDDLARELGRFDTLEELKADIRKNLEKRRAQDARRVREQAIMEHLRSTHDFEVPPSLVQEEARSLTEAYFRQMAQYGIQPNPDAEIIRAVYESQREEAEKRVRESILLTLVADNHNIQPEDDDINAILEEYVEDQKDTMPLDTLKKHLEENGELDQIRSIARQRKTFDYLMSQVTFEEKEPEATEEAQAKPTGKKNASGKNKTTASSNSKKKKDDHEMEDSHADSDGN